MQTAIYFLIGLTIFVGLIIIQIFLSKLKDEWPGYILPILGLVASFIPPFLMPISPLGINLGHILGFIVLWVACNIPTLVFIAIFKSKAAVAARNK